MKLRKLLPLVLIVLSISACKVTSGSGNNSNSGDSTNDNSQVVSVVLQTKLSNVYSSYAAEAIDNVVDATGTQIVYVNKEGIVIEDKNDESKTYYYESNKWVEGLPNNPDTYYYDSSTGKWVAESSNSSSGGDEYVLVYVAGSKEESLFNGYVVKFCMNKQLYDSITQRAEEAELRAKLSNAYIMYVAEAIDEVVDATGASIICVEQVKIALIDSTDSSKTYHYDKNEGKWATGLPDKPSDDKEYELVYVSETIEDSTYNGYVMMYYKEKIDEQKIIQSNLRNAYAEYVAEAADGRVDRTGHEIKLVDVNQATLVEAGGLNPKSYYVNNTGVWLEGLPAKPSNDKEYELVCVAETFEESTFGGYVVMYYEEKQIDPDAEQRAEEIKLQVNLRTAYSEYLAEAVDGVVDATGSPIVILEQTKVALINSEDESKTYCYDISNSKWTTGLPAKPSDDKEYELAYVAGTKEQSTFNGFAVMYYAAK